MKRIILAAAIFMAAFRSYDAFAGASVYTLKFDDPKGVFFTEEEFGIRADGKFDVSDALQAAVNRIKEERGFGTLYLPEGKYRISRTIYVPGSIRIVGYGKSRPEIVLEKNTPGFDKEQTSMMWFTGGIVTDPSRVADASAGTFYSGVSNVDFRIGKGNPMAIALRTHLAQHGIVSHVSVYGGDGFACLYDAGNELEDVEFFGARYGISSGVSSPSWPIAMVDAYFEGQKEAAIISRNAGFAIVNMKVKDAPAGIICERGLADRLFLEDCSFENVGTAVTITGEEGETNQLNILNAHCRNVPVAVSLTKAGKDFPVKDRSYRIEEFVYGLIVPEMGAEPEFGTVCKTVSEEFPSTFRKTIPALPDMSTWASVVSRQDHEILGFPAGKDRTDGRAGDDDAHSPGNGPGSDNGPPECRFRQPRRRGGELGTFPDAYRSCPGVLIRRRSRRPEAGEVHEAGDGGCLSPFPGL